MWRCGGASECDRAWPAAESAVAQNADECIKSVTASLIDTYKLIVAREIRMPVYRVAAAPDESEMLLTVACRVRQLRQMWPRSELRIYSAFLRFMQLSQAS